MENTANPDDVDRHYSRRRVRLSVRILESTATDGTPSVLIEGSQASLEYLADVIRAVAKDEDCGYQLPLGPGSKRSAPDTTHGIYIHRTPCINEALNRAANHSGQTRNGVPLFVPKPGVRRRPNLRTVNKLRDAE